MMLPFSNKSSFHILMNCVIVILFLAAGLILGSHLVLKGIQKEHAIDVTLSKIERIEKELDEVRSSVLLDGEKIADLHKTIKLHQEQIMKDRKKADRH